MLPLLMAACSGNGQQLSALPQVAREHGAPRGAMRPHDAGSITVSGTITAMISGGFTLDVTQGCPTNGYLHVYTNASTTFGGPSPATGLAATATGAGSCSTSLTASQVTTNLKTLVAAPIPLQPNQTSVASTVYSIWKGGFTLAPEPSLGYMHVYTSASTAFAGIALKTAAYAQVTGTGPVTSFNGVYVSLYASPPPTITVSGTAAAGQPYGFTAYVDSTHPAVPIVLNAKTIVAGAALVTGATVKVTGAGSTSVSITATQVVVSTPSPAPGQSPAPTPSPIAQTHVLTADYLGAPYGTTSVTATAAAPYLTWAQTSIQNANATAAAGIKTQYYVDPNRTVAGVGDALYTSDETTFAHDCNNARITDTYNGSTTQYVMDPSSATMQALFASFVASAAAQAHFDAIYEDDDGPLSGFTSYTPFSAMPCSYGDAAWLTSELGLNAASSIPEIFNGLSALDNDSVSQSVGLLSSNTLGGNYEECYSNTATPKMTGWLWQAIENTELAVTAKQKLFECQLRNSASAATQTDARLYAIASFLLTYSPSQSVLWEEFATTSGLHVEPESQLVVLDPIVTTPAAVTGLQVAGGTYGREYAQCFVAGKFVGACAVVVNPDSQLSHPFPYPQYTHTLVLSGSGVLDGGTIATNGPPPPVNIAPSEAAVVFP